MIFIFYVVIQMSKRFLCFIKYFYYLCVQEVEEEASSAGEQLASNRLPALHRNTYWDGTFVLSLFYCYGYRSMAKKTHRFALP